MNSQFMTNKVGTLGGARESSSINDAGKTYRGEKRNLVQISFRPYTTVNSKYIRDLDNKK